MSRTVSIEVAAAQGTSPIEKGGILEQFARRLLETQNFAVTEEVRLTGTEVDLLAIENTTGERIFVECKGELPDHGERSLQSDGNPPFGGCFPDDCINCLSLEPLWSR